MIETIKIILLSVLYGITAVLPVSSLGHFALFKEVLGYTDENFNANFYYALFSIGAGLAMYIYYFSVHKKIFSNLFRSKKKLTTQAKAAYHAAGRNIILSLIPMIILFIPLGDLGYVGLLGSYFLSDGSLIFVGIASILCALLMFISIWYIRSEYTSKENLLSPKNAVFFGIYQLPAYIFPGVSHISVGASRTAVSDIDLRNILKETYLYTAPAFILTGFAKVLYYYLRGGEINTLAAIIGLVLSFGITFLILSFINKFFSKKAYKAFAVYTLVFGLIITGASLYIMLA